MVDCYRHLSLSPQMKLRSVMRGVFYRCRHLIAPTNETQDHFNTLRLSDLADFRRHIFRKIQKLSAFWWNMKKIFSPLGLLTGALVRLWWSVFEEGSPMRCFRGVTIASYKLFPVLGTMLFPMARSGPSISMDF